MRQFQQIVHELKSIVADPARYKPGEPVAPPPSLPFVTIDERKLYYAAMEPEKDVSGKPPVIFLHGFGGFFMDWPRVMMPVARHTRVFAIDLPGWGFSDVNANAKALEDDVAAVQTFLAQMNLQDAILCGISYGGGLAWAAAAMGCARVRQAVLLNPMPPDPMSFMHSGLYQGIFALNTSRRAALIGHKMLRKSHYKMICRENLLNDRLLDTFYLDMAYLLIKQPKIPFVLHAHATGARQVDWTEWEHRLAGAHMPVTILQGTDDRIFSMESANHLHEIIPHSRLIEVKDCGHAMVFDQHRKVSDFLIEEIEQAVKTQPRRALG